MMLVHSLYFFYAESFAISYAYKDHYKEKSKNKFALKHIYPESRMIHRFVRMNSHLCE